MKNMQTARRYRPLSICRFAAAVFFIAAAAAIQAFDPDPEQEALYRANRERVAAWTEQMRTDAGDDENRLVLPGLLADRERRQVRFWAEATGIEPGKAVEFVLISERSGHDYEALAVALAEPSAIHEALTFIDMVPGVPVDPARLRFWPRGERVWVTFHWSTPSTEPGGQPLAQHAEAEKLLYDQRRQTAVPVEGFVFTGSHRRPHPRTGEQVYAADIFGPNSIVSLYNQPFSVLDVPRLAAQGDVYGSIVPNPDRLLEAGKLLQVVLEPEYPPGKNRVFMGHLLIAPAGGESGARVSGSEGLRLVIEPACAADTAPPLDGGTVEFLAWLGRMADEGRDPFLVLRPAAALAWGALRDFYRLVHTVENARGIRVEPPEDDQLYYRALLPAAWFRDREQRMAHPDELHLSAAPEGAGVTRAVWKRFEEKWPDTHSLDPVVNVHAETVADAGAFAARIRELAYRPQPAVLLVFAPAALTVQTLYEWMLPLRETYPTQYVFDSEDGEPAAL